MNDLPDIRKRLGIIRQTRMDEQHRVMEAYQKDVYIPAMNQLVQDCAIIGHHRGTFWDNGLGWSWFYCSNCGARMDVTHNDE